MRHGIAGLLPRRGGLAWGTVGTLALNTSTTFLNFGVALLLARLLGADGYGAFAFALAWSMVLSSFAGLGLSPLVVRHVAATRARADWWTLRGVLRWTNVVVLATSLLAASVAALCGWWLVDETLLRPLLIGLVLVPPTALIMLRQSAMQGLGQVVLGRVPETLIVPGLLLVLAAVVGLALGDSFSASWAVSLQVLSTMVAFGVGAALLARSIPEVARDATPRYELRSWAHSALPLFLLGLLGAVNAQVGTILLGSFEAPEDAGVFALALRLSSFSGFIFLAVTYPLMPAVAHLHSLGERDQMRATITRAARAVFIVTVPVALAIVVLAEPLLGLFGDDFRGGAAAVRILVAGELVKAFFGLSGLLLVMTGRESDLTRGVALGGVVNVLLALVLIPLLSVGGAAIAGAAGMASMNLVLAWLSRKRLGFAGAAGSGFQSTRRDS